MRPSAELHHFPADRIHRFAGGRPVTGRVGSADPEGSATAAQHDDHVTVTHQGMSKVYDCPGDLHAAVLVACGPELRLAERRRARHRIRRHAAAVRRLLAASGRARLARRSRPSQDSQRRWQALNRTLEAFAVTGALAGVVAFLLGLGQ